MKFKIIIFSFVFLFVHCFTFSQNMNKTQESSGNVKLGAYYFDGWTGTYSYHITPELINSYPEREPKWGWITSTQKIVDQQIELASKSGLSFFSFCWYYTGKYKYQNEPLNRALHLYLNSLNVNKLEYTLLVTNTGGAAIGPDDWEIVCEEWINLFKSNLYLKADGKPLITFFSINSLLEKFQTSEEVKKAFEKLKSKAVEAGLKGVSIAVAIGPSKTEVQLAESCGFDILTGYNYHSAGFIADKKIVPIENMQKNELNVWNVFPKVTKLPYIPVTTINWDPRPWASSTNNYANAPYFVGFSSTSVYNSVLACKKWIENNSKYTVWEKIGLIYAWNEYGEGAYLTPTKTGNNPLEGISKAVTE